MQVQVNETTLTGKQKRFLRAMGSTLDPVVQIGKSGVIDTVTESAEQALAAREIIKVRVLQNSPEEPKAAIAALAKATGAELVQVIGRNGLLYKKNEEKSKIELP
ncbi:RNA-binding protein [Sporomusa paucivorans]|uniref:RNA-binding protein n=2 Tax=Sporomusa TaxID=2375 RepID=A0ABP2CDA2_9FIRM|nr:ribosome assembly RNA-binding protein YhbY [Sporomusa sphaeroides]OLS57927.1 RNA-binding protein [Sporomusa sphaeroides DSM 2875]CVK20440.1 RNA-binding protein [Sporomusa sphaeroides DSM 2875]SCM80694.1 putative RNA-binding protein YqeI [uncultured Sporomusa sp.]